MDSLPSVQLSIARKRSRTYWGHVSQIFTGFELLAEQGEIRLNRSIGGYGLTAQVGGMCLYYDVTDGPEIDDFALERCDLYFKRSYSARVVSACARADRIKPLGLNFEIYHARRDWWGAYRGLMLSGDLATKIKSARKALRLTRYFAPTIEALDEPFISAEPRVIFLTRTWDGIRSNSEGAPVAAELNEVRAACIRALRAEFGPRALTGF